MNRYPIGTPVKDGQHSKIAAGTVFGYDDTCIIIQKYDGKLTWSVGGYYKASEADVLRANALFARQHQTQGVEFP